MKKILVLLMVAVLTMSMSAVVFAEETAGEKPQRTELTKEERQAKVEELFNTYYPDGLAAFNAINEAHKAFHDNAKSEREAFKAEVLAAREAFKQSVKDGEMTREEAKAIMEENKQNMQLVREEIKSIIELKKSDVAANREELKLVRTALREALKGEEVDASVVANLLGQMTTLLEEHLDIDNYYYNMIQNINNDSI